MTIVAVEISLQLSDEIPEDGVLRLREDVKRYLSHMLAAARAYDERVQIRDVALDVTPPLYSQQAEESVELARLRHSAGVARQHATRMRVMHHDIDAQTRGLMQGLDEFRARLSALPKAR